MLKLGTRWAASALQEDIFPFHFRYSEGDVLWYISAGWHSSQGVWSQSQSHIIMESIVLLRASLWLRSIGVLLFYYKIYRAGLQYCILNCVHNMCKTHVVVQFVFYIEWLWAFFPFYSIRLNITYYLKITRISQRQHNECGEFKGVDATEARSLSFNEYFIGNTSYFVES